MRTCLPIVLVILTGFVSAQPAVAGLYSVNEPCPFTIRQDGTAEVLSFNPQGDGAFPTRFSVLLNAADANPARANNPDRQRYQAWVAGLQSQGPGHLPPYEVASLAADMLRVGLADGALNTLAPRSRTGDFRVLANLAHIHATRGEWDDALRYHQSALLDADFPDDLHGTGPTQRQWLKSVERTYYKRWLQLHRERVKLPPAEEDVFPLFPIKFVGESGQYEPGKLAAAERAKLPTDAIAVVQQLLLWSPGDTGLYWLLAELYAAEGRLREAELIFNQCADGRQFSNRRIFMAHRAAIREAVAKLPKEVSPDDIALTPPPAPPTDPAAFLPSEGRLVVVAAVFAVVVLGLIVLQVRAIARRR